MTFQEELQHLINRHNMERASDTPDFALAEFLTKCLEAYGVAAKKKDKFFGFEPWPLGVINLPAKEDEIQDAEFEDDEIEAEEIEILKEIEKEEKELNTDPDEFF